MNNNPITLSRILNGINTSLNIANKVMPIYKETKPIITTVSKTYNSLKNNKNNISNIIKLTKLNKLSKTNIKKDITKNKEIKLINNQTYKNNNNPTFFI